MFEDKAEADKVEADKVVNIGEGTAVTYWGIEHTRRIGLMCLVAGRTILSREDMKAAIDQLGKIVIVLLGLT